MTAPGYAAAPAQARVQASFRGKVPFRARGAVGAFLDLVVTLG